VAAAPPAGAAESGKLCPSAGGATGPDDWLRPLHRPKVSQPSVAGVLCEPSRAHCRAWGTPHAQAAPAPVTPHHGRLSQQRDHRDPTTSSRAAEHSVGGTSSAKVPQRTTRTPGATGTAERTNACRLHPECTQLACYARDSGGARGADARAFRPRRRSTQSRLRRRIVGWHRPTDLAGVLTLNTEEIVPLRVIPPPLHPAPA
jgi:hypothetical protein